MLLKAVKWICQPLIKLLIKQGITYPVFCELIKSVYVETAQANLNANKTTPSLSRIFIKTGIHRKEIKRIVEEILSSDENNAPGSHTATLGALLVSRWVGLPEYVDENGAPRKLPRISDNNKEPGFNHLVTSVSKDIHPRALLDEWLELDIVSIDSKDRVCLNEKSFIPRAGFNEKVYFFGKNVRDHMDTCVHNLTTDLPPLLERSVYYASLSADSVHKLQAIANQKALETLELINKEALSLKENDKKQGDSTCRFRFGCYWFDNSNNSSRDTPPDK